MRPTIAARSASVTAAEEGRSRPPWTQAQVDVAPVTPLQPRPARPTPTIEDDDLAPARGIGVAMITGLVLWLGLGWGLVELFALFI